MTSSTEKALENLRTNIRFYRKKQNMTQVKLALIVGVSVDFIQLLEAGKRKPGFDVLCKLANAFNIEPFELLKPQEK